MVQPGSDVQSKQPQQQFPPRKLPPRAPVKSPGPVDPSAGNLKPTSRPWQRLKAIDRTPATFTVAAAGTCTIDLPVASIGQPQFGSVVGQRPSSIGVDAPAYAQFRIVDTGDFSPSGPPLYLGYWIATLIFTSYPFAGGQEQTTYRDVTSQMLTSLGRLRVSFAQSEFSRVQLRLQNGHTSARSVQCTAEFWGVDNYGQGFM